MNLGCCETIVFSLNQVAFSILGNKYLVGAKCGGEIFHYDEAAINLSHKIKSTYSYF